MPARRKGAAGVWVVLPMHAHCARWRQVNRRARLRGGTDTGSIAIAAFGTDYETSCHQFAYFANLGVTGESYSALDSANGFAKAAGSSWWLRSADRSSEDASFDGYFRVVVGNGFPGKTLAYRGRAVLPCFCL